MMPLSPYDIENKEYCCPVCGEPTDFLYVNGDDEVVGCVLCLHLRCSEDVLDEIGDQPETDE